MHALEHLNTDSELDPVDDVQPMKLTQPSILLAGDGDDLDRSVENTL